MVQWFVKKPSVMEFVPNISCVVFSIFISEIILGWMMVGRVNIGLTFFWVLIILWLLILNEVSINDRSGGMVLIFTSFYLREGHC